MAPCRWRMSTRLGQALLGALAAVSPPREIGAESFLSTPSPDEMSSFAWLDYSDADRQRALDVLDLFRERGTVDELGIGTVRDGMADVLFPGTSTIMSRARYFFFIPWMYQQLERKGVSSAEVAQKARRAEIRLIEALVDAGEREGVIGIEARRDLKRLPSTIYWQGLGVLGFRLVPKSRDAYHRSLDQFYRLGGDALRGNEGHEIVGGRRHNWHPAIPAPPDDFPDRAVLALTADEADFFRERVRHAAPESFFSQLAWNLEVFEDSDAPWDEPIVERLSPRAAAHVLHARNLSDAMLGAALTYNLMLAEKANWEERVENYEARIDEWVSNVTLRREALLRWDRQAFWETVRISGRQVPHSSREFIDSWLDRLLEGDPAALVQDRAIRERIRQRERRLKGSLARLHNPSALARWGGASSAAALDFRWNRPTRRILQDLKDALVTQ